MSSYHASNSALSLKQRQVAHLAQQMTVLSERAHELEKLTDVTAEQARSFRLLSGYHAASFMAASAVMTPGDNANDNAKTQEP